MKLAEENYREFIRDAMNEAMGVSRPISFKEAAEGSGVNINTLYAISRGDDRQVPYPERYLAQLLEVPEFAEAYMTSRGYACAHIANEKACPWSVTSAVGRIMGKIAVMVADGKFSPSEHSELARGLRDVIRKSVAFVHKFKSDRLTTRAGA